MLAELGVGRQCREETHGITQVQGPLGEVKPLRPALIVLHCLERLQYKESLGSSRWLTMAILQLAEEEELTHPLPERAHPPFIVVLGLFPQIS